MLVQIIAKCSHACVQMCLCAHVRVCKCSCVQMCLCANVCVCSNVRVRKCACVQTCLCANVLVCKGACVQMCFCANARVYKCACVQMRMCANARACKCACVRVCKSLFVIIVTLRNCDRVELVVCHGGARVRACARACSHPCDHASSDDSNAARDFLVLGDDCPLRNICCHNHHPMINTCCLMISYMHRLNHSHITCCLQSLRNMARMPLMVWLSLRVTSSCFHRLGLRGFLHCLLDAT